LCIDLLRAPYNLQELNNAIWRFNNEELNAGNTLTNFLDFYNVWKVKINRPM